MSTAGLRLKFTPQPAADKTRPFNFAQDVPTSPTQQSEDELQLPAPPTSWLPAKEQRVYGSEPLRDNGGYVKCKDCAKVVMKSTLTDHMDTCKKIKAGVLPPPNAKKSGKTVDFIDVSAATGGSSKKGKKRKAEDGPDELGDDGLPKKKAKTTGKARVKGPVNLDTQCGVINDKNLPCSRALKCKTHSMGAKRAVQGRSKPYDELLLDFNRLHDPNFVEPVKKETKAEKQAAKQREREEKKRLAQEAKAAATAAAAGAKKAKAPPKEPAPVVVQEEDLAALDSEAEIDSLVMAVRGAMRRGVIAVPLATPADLSGSWFVQRREAYRSSIELLASALQMGPRVAQSAA